MLWNMFFNTLFFMLVYPQQECNVVTDPIVCAQVTTVY